MRNILIYPLLINCLFLIPAHAQNVTSDARHEGLTGRIKNIRSETAKLVNKSNQWVEEKRQLNRIITYDETGNKAREEIFTDIIDNPDLERRAKTQITYRYDARGNRTETFTSTKIGDNEFQLFRRIFRSDASGKRIEEAIHGKRVRWSEELGLRPTNVLGGERLFGIYVHSYDTNGNRTVTEWKENGIVYDKWVYTLDSKGVVKELEHYRRNRLRVKEAFEYEFDATGNWIKRTRSKWVVKGGASSFVPQEIEYRSITYY